MNKISIDSFKQITRFGIVGVLNTIVGYGVYWMLIEMNINYILALPISSIIGIIHSYCWNKFWTFKSKQKSINEAIRFVAVYGITFIINLGLLTFMVEVLGLDKQVSGFISLLIVSLLSFIGHRLWSFKKVDILK
jgi:putative flippase GtrA